MKLILSCLSSNRQLGKAMRRIRPLLCDLFHSLEAQSGSQPAEIELWLVDKDVDYLEQQQNKDGVYEIHAGYDCAFRFSPSTDRDFARFLLDRIHAVVAGCPLSDEERTALLRIIEECQAVWDRSPFGSWQASCQDT